jgi:hypothetical protein
MNIFNFEAEQVLFIEGLACQQCRWQVTLVQGSGDKTCLNISTDA